MAEAKIGLYVTVPLYMLFIVCTGLYTYLKNRSQMQTSMQGEEALSQHYLGGRSFGPFVTMMTLFASLFSGYTVIGIPAEAASDGFTALSWILLIQYVVMAQLVVMPRLRRLSEVRHYQGPGDFLSDRFRSQVLRYLVVILLMLVPSWMYLTAQINALTSVFNRLLFQLPDDSPWGTLIIATIILVYEWLGGLGAVALADSLAGSVMLLGSLCLLVITCWRFGGLSGLDAQTYPKPQFYQVPELDTQASLWGFAVSGLGFAALPHIMQRVYAAKHTHSLKLAWSVMACGSWIVQATGVVFGIVSVDWITPAEWAQPFGPMLELVMDTNWANYLVGLLLFTATLAAIMSTADSLLLAISHTLAVDFLLPLYPRASAARLSLLGKISSLISMVIAVGLSFLMSDKALSYLAQVQFGISLQALPPFVIGLYVKRRLDPWLLAAGALLGLALLFILEYGYNNHAASQVPAGLIALVSNVAFVAVCSVVPGVSIPAGRWDAIHTTRFGEGELTGELLASLVAGTVEPVSFSWYLPTCVLLSLLALPMVAGGSPPIDSEGRLAYAPTLWLGCPDWVWNLIVATLAITLINVRMAWSWKSNACAVQPSTDQAQLSANAPPQHSATASCASSLAQLEVQLSPLSNARGAASYTAGGAGDGWALNDAALAAAPNPLKREDRVGGLAGDFDRHLCRPVEDQALNLSRLDNVKDCRRIGARSAVMDVNVRHSPTVDSLCTKSADHRVSIDRSLARSTVRGSREHP
eukprot:CAMPEP_0183352634 /NCGR_PEP_ID=MMETSP0164_2-20130417/29563_1 /TAXON_ID=221442 /ORGANISM="Coccolithus pelagicus ssp braarudi, Strain PLY182g" /LENGTH=753 /DNA_ID=CAMNT_0025525115 /DNA_START=56 /DNA_END=2318 /DNA_ORIENTATION=-